MFFLAVIFLLGDPVHAVPGSDTLKIWLQKVPRDSSGVNQLLDRCSKMLRTSSPEEIAPFLKRAEELNDSILQQAPQTAIYSLKKKKARIYIIHGILHSYNGDLDKEVIELKEALKIYRSLGLKKGIGNIYHNLAANLGDQGKFPEALSYEQQALKIREEIKDSGGLANTFFLMSRLYCFTKDHKSAVDYASRAVLIQRNLKDFFGVAECLSHLGIVYYDAEKNKDALEAWKEALRLADSLDYTLMKGIILNNLGNIFMEENKPDTAAIYYRKALVINTMLGDGKNRTTTTTNLGKAYNRMGKFAEAKKILHNNIDSVKKYKSDGGIETLYEQLISCDSALGDFAGAFRYTRLLNLVQTKAFEDTKLQQLKELQVNHDLRKKEEENRNLLDQNRIQGLEISRNRLLTLILCVSLILLLAFFLFVLRYNKFRTTEKAIKLEQRLLRLQMNPHFIFNCLQAIQNYLRKNDKKETEHYLDSFASLTRDVLENSRVEVIPLQKELDLLTNYLQLQKLRFEDRFEYTIHVSRDINPNSIFLPPMLSQPFIENAIEHGLSDIDSGGKIDVYFAVRKDYLVMEIIDNGGGIQSNDTQHKDHSSLAVEITKERIALINKKNKRKSTFDINDADPSNPQRKGVKVSFSIPIPIDW